MSFIPTEEQQLLRESASAFVRDHSSLKRIRALRDGNDPDGFSRDLWKRIADLGWLGITIPEEYGGLGLGYADLCVVLEEFGRGLMPEPWLSTVLLGAMTVLRGGNDQQKESLLPALVSGDLLLALAFQEVASRYDVCDVQTKAERAGTGWRVSGEKRFVFDGHVADRLIVSARTSGNRRDRDGVTLFLVDARGPGIAIHRQSMLDTRNAAIVKLTDVAVADSDVVGEPNGGGRLLADVVDRATVGLCAEMLGSMSGAFEMTLDYLKTRKQFGAPIGSFQALKHRAAAMFIECELARSAVMAAAAAADANDPKLRETISIAKARCSDAFLLIANESVQMHGGIGMTDEHDIGFFFKRARAAEMTFGDAAWHRTRFAELRGF